MPLTILPADVDECQLFRDQVCKSGVCVNTAPGYSCYCSNGYYYHAQRLECIGRNPTSTGTHTPAWDSPQALATPAPLWNVASTSRKSFLEPRLHLSHRQCTGEMGKGRGLLLDHFLRASLDNDECADEEPACEGGSCVNTIGSYHCTCEPPLVLDGSGRRCVSNESQSLGNPSPRPAPPVSPAPVSPTQSSPSLPPLSLTPRTRATPLHAPFSFRSQCLTLGTRGQRARLKAKVVEEPPCHFLALCTRARSLSPLGSQLPFCTLGGLAIASTL